MKLELKHLAPYLPYKLTLYMKGFPHVELNGLDAHNDYSRWKPILRPMSDLVKEIDGIVPFEEIAKIEAPNIVGSVEKLRKITAFKRGMSFNSHQTGVYYKYENVQVEITLFKDDIFHKKVVDGNDSWVFSYFHNYPAILDFLYSKHFDTKGLIKKGLAIDINSLPAKGLKT